MIPNAFAAFEDFRLQKVQIDVRENQFIDLDTLQHFAEVEKVPVFAGVG